MSKLLIIGASVLQLPAIIKAKELGHYIAVVDYNPNAIGIPFADAFYNISTIDEVAICNLAKSIKPDGILTLATDLPMRSVAAATTLLNLPGISYETAVKATDKGEMIRAFHEYHVETPWFHILSNGKVTKENLSHISFPCIVKPTDNSGSRGVIRVDHAKDFADACNYSQVHSRNGQIIVEEYMTGREVSVEMIIYNGNIHVVAVTDKITTGAPYFVEMGHTQPSMIEPESQLKIKDLALRAVQAIGIENGAAHVEIMLTPEGPKMIELGARLGGDCISTHLVLLSTGVDMVKAVIDISLGKMPDINPSIQKGCAIRYFKPDQGILASVTGVEKARGSEGIKEITLTKSIGEKVVEIKSSSDRVGFIISQGKDALEAVHFCSNAMNSIHFKVNA